jgi:lipid-A-disaccharide synthase
LFFVSAGEPSGDLHGSNLIRHLRAHDPAARFVGFGGPKMAEAGCELIEDMASLAVMWIVRVVLKLGTFLKLLILADRVMRDQRPDAVVLIDFPGFNWWVARRAKARGIPVFYYGAPQIWAWAQWRIKKMRRLVDHVLCKLPFEEAWYGQQGCRATYVGHPYFDELENQTLDAAFLVALASERPLVTILPGSRTQEVTLNFRWLLKAADRVHRRVPSARFAVAAFRESHALLIRREIERAGGDLPIEVYVQRTPELMHLARCCLAVSGSVSLELLYHAKPTVILYWTGRFGYFMQSILRKVKYITLVNLLATDELFPQDLRPFDPRQPDADRVLMPEYLTHQDKSREIAAHAIEWLTDESRRAERVGRMEALRDQVGHAGASRRAAQYIADVLEGRRPGAIESPTSAAA